MIVRWRLYVELEWSFPMKGVRGFAIRWTAAAALPLRVYVDGWTADGADASQAPRSSRAPPAHYP